jgi:hypothetical protein
VGDNPVEERADHLPLALLPFLVHRQDLPADRQEAGMDQQTQIQHGRAVVQRRRVEHKDQASSTPEAQERAEQLRPQREHHDLLIGQKPGQAAFDAGRFGGADADERLSDPRQARRASECDAQHTESQRFAAVSMERGQKRPQLRRPLAPQTLRCVHRDKRSFPMTRF